MSWFASLAPFVMAAGTGIASAIGTHIGNKAMQNTTTSNAGAQTSDVPVQSVETSDNAIALPEDVAQPVIVDGTGGTIGDQFKSTAKNLGTEAIKRGIDIGAEYISSAIKKLSFKELKRKGRDLYSLGKEAYHNFWGNKEGASDEQRIRFFNYINDNFEDNLEQLLSFAKGSEPLKVMTKMNVMNYIKNLSEIRRLQEKEGIDSPRIRDLLKKSDLQAGAAAIKNVLQTIAAQYNYTSEEAPFWSGLVNMLTKIMNINSPYALAAITAAELAGTIGPVKRLIFRLFGKKDTQPQKKDTETNTSKAHYPYNDGTTPVYGYPYYDPYTYYNIYNMKQRQLEDLYRQGVYPEYLSQIRQPYWYHYQNPRIGPAYDPPPLTYEPEDNSTRSGPKVEEVT